MLTILTILTILTYHMGCQICISAPYAYDTLYTLYMGKHDITHYWEYAPNHNAAQKSFPGTPWYSLVLPGTPWCSLMLPGAPWYSLVLPGAPWCSLSNMHNYAIMYTYYTILTYYTIHMGICSQSQ
jgi:hypothetical protein